MFQIFSSIKIFFIVGSKIFVPYFYRFISYFHNHNKNLYNKFEFLEN